MPTQIHLLAPGKDENVSELALATEPLDDKRTYEAGVCYLEVAPGVRLRGITVLDHIFVDTKGEGHHNYSGWNTWRGRSIREVQVATPFFKARIVSPFATTKVVPKTRYRRGYDYYNQREEQYQEVDNYCPSCYSTGCDCTNKVPYAYLTIEISTLDGSVVTEGDFRFRQPTTGEVTFLIGKTVAQPEFQITSTFFGLKRTWKESVVKGTMNTNRSSNSQDQSGLAALYRHAGSIPATEIDAWWELFFRCNGDATKHACADTAGLTSIYNRKAIKPNIDRLQKDSWIDYRFLTWLQDSASFEKKKNNSLLSAFLQKVGDNYDTLLAALRKARIEVAPTTGGDNNSYRSKGHQWHDSRRAICLSLPGAEEKVQEQEAKADWRKRKSLAGQAEGLGIVQTDHPKLWAAVEAGQIPTSIFHQPSGEPVNLEFDLWEKALNRKGWAPVIHEIAQTASTRGTYEKDISPFLMFLFNIERYLKKHTGKKWSAMPTFVRSQWDLEMAEEDNENGTVKKRSAMTPVADNTTQIVTVPYVAMVVSGVRTQWCYARYYHLFEEGMTDPISGGVVTKDFEEKLNGRDDYGLCFYTLTGTDTARGYPTFLIIFERLTKGTRVHFHRVRPQRIKDGKKTLACKLVEACYQYMAGNIPAKDIMAQQGDLIFIPHRTDPIKGNAKVEEALVGTSLVFESHNLISPSGDLALYRSTAKTPNNRLGFLHVPTTLDVKHPEHEHLEGLMAGWYEIRRCKSWEANPKAIWSRTID